MKKAIIVAIGLSVLVAVSCPAGYAQGNIDKGTLNEIISEAELLKEQCDSIAYYLDRISSNRTAVSKAEREMAEYVKKPFASMTLSKVSLLTDDYKAIMDAFMVYDDARRMLSQPYNAEKLKVSVKKLKDLCKSSDINAAQKADVNELALVIDSYRDAASDVASFVKKKNELCRGLLNDYYTLTRKAWTELNDPWKTVPDVKTGIENGLDALQENYSRIPYMSVWISGYRKLLFTDKVPPYTKTPVGDNYEVDEGLKSMEREFGID